MTRHEAEAQRAGGRTFPVITREKQRRYERQDSHEREDIPCICGIHGRACRQMDKAEGANRALCTFCTLARFCSR